MKKVIALATALVMFASNSFVSDAEDRACYIPQEYIDICDEMQEEYGVSSSLLIAIIECESSGDRYAVSPGGNCFGLMQVHEINNPEGLDLFDPRTNIELGTQILLSYRDQFEDDGEDLYLVLSAYNGLSKAYEYYKAGRYDKLVYAQKVLKLADEITKERDGLCFTQ